MSIGIDRCCNLDCDNWDNGVYIVKGWEIVGRQYFQGTEQDIYNLEEMIREIDACQPEMDRLYKEDANANTKHE